MLEGMKISEQPQFDLSLDNLAHVKDKAFDGRYFTVHDEGVRFLDPLLQDPVASGQIPPSIYTTPTLAEGIEYLQERGGSNDLNVQLLLGYHGSAEDFRDIREEFSEKLGIAACAGIETSWKTIHNPERPFFADIHPDTSHSPRGRREFQKVQLDFLKQEHIVPLPCDLSDGPDHQSYLNDELNRLWSIREHASHILKNPAEQHAAKVIADRLYQGVRQWMIIGHLGQWIMQAERQDFISSERQTVPLILGSGHYLSANRLNKLGIPTETHRVPEKDGVTPQVQRYRSMMAHASYDFAIDWQALQTPEVRPAA